MTPPHPTSPPRVKHPSGLRARYWNYSRLVTCRCVCVSLSARARCYIRRGSWRGAAARVRVGCQARGSPWCGATRGIERLSATGYSTVSTKSGQHAPHEQLFVPAPPPHDINMGADLRWRAGGAGGLEGWMDGYKVQKGRDINSGRKQFRVGEGREITAAGMAAAHWGGSQRGCLGRRVVPPPATCCCCWAPSAHCTGFRVQGARRLMLPAAAPGLHATCAGPQAPPPTTTPPPPLSPSSLRSACRPPPTPHPPHHHTPTPYHVLHTHTHLIMLSR